MKKSRRSGRGTKADDNQKLISGITRGNLGHPSKSGGKNDKKRYN